MNLTHIKEILDSNMPSELKEISILKTISEDEMAIPTILRILNQERMDEKELIMDMNMQLSRAHLAIEKPILNEDNFVVSEIIKFYKKNNGKIGHCFRDYDKL